MGIHIFVCFGVFFACFLQNLKSLSVPLVSLPFDVVGFCDNCSLWSYTFLFVFKCFCLFVVLCNI